MCFFQSSTWFYTMTWKLGHRPLECSASHTHLLVSASMWLDQCPRFKRAQVLWILPAYLVSFLMNGWWYQDIAEYAYLVKHNAKVKPLPKLSAVKILAVEIYRVVLVAGLVIQHQLMSKLAKVPYLGPVFFLIGVDSLLFALSASRVGDARLDLRILQLRVRVGLGMLTASRYVWSINGWSVDRRIAHFETNYAYFLGFGMPCALITAFVPFFVSNGIFALVFPVLIILATASNIVEKPAETTSGWLPRRLPILRPIDLVSSKILVACNAFVTQNPPS
eukprot:TRINITY_DN9249_c0_g1_i4.p1 TRINITY_DN9249_c0_g1~~TRINITY_DN9249_c0_g1_i4.p1  ORF type:complete len:278 (-),score=19.38 TRINITY_DN9249_c0_g1_i4:385-1218(-)